ncbi:hypothetical protein PSHT_01282, partial [Puccinia striiformis]
MWMSRTGKFYMLGGELPFAKIPGDSNPESDRLDTPPAIKMGLTLLFSQLEESVELSYHQLQTGVEEGHVSAALEQAQQERVTNQVWPKLKLIPQQPSRSGTFTKPTEPVEEVDMGFINIFGDARSVGPTTVAPKATVTGGKIRQKDHL